VRSSNVNATALALQQVQLENNTGAATNQGCYCRSLDAQLRERPQSENQTGIEDNVYEISQPQDPHGSRGIANTSEDSVDVLDTSGDGT